MKKRIGFVSNSSSSSFILIGIKIDDKISKEELAKKYLTEKAINEFIGDDVAHYTTGNDVEGWWEDLWNECAYGNGGFIVPGLEFISDDYNSFLGKILTDNEYLEDGEYSFAELIEIAEKINFDDECKLYYGNRQC